MMRYYQLWTSTTRPVEPDWEWAESFRDKNACHGCGEFYPSVNDGNVIVEQVPRNVHFTFVDGVLSYVLSEALVAKIGRTDLRHCLVMGAVRDRTGHEIEGYVSVLGRKTIGIRGGPDSCYRICVQCGRPVYTPIGEYYILASDLSDSPIYQAHVGLVLNEEIHRRISAQCWDDDFHLDELPVLHDPCDGYPNQL